MKRLTVIFAMIVIATVSKAQSFQPQRPQGVQVEDIKAVDSMSVKGVPINALVFRSITVSGNVGTVSSFMGYRKGTSQSVSLSLNFGSEIVSLPDTLTVASTKVYIENAIATKHSITIH